jgi:hypothetical protein
MRERAAVPRTTSHEGIFQTVNRVNAKRAIQKSDGDRTVLVHTGR